MAGITKEPGPTARRVAVNIRRIRRERWQDINQAELSRRLTELDQPIPETSITKTEQGTRRVDVDDLVAIALALGVTPNTLLLPEVSYVGSADTHHVTPAVTGTAGEAWLWAQGEKPLLIPVEGGRSWLGRDEFPVAEFAVRNRPYLTAISAPGESDTPIPDEVLRDVSAAVQRAMRAGASASQVRRVVELSAVLPVLVATGRAHLLAAGSDRRQP